MAKSKTVASRLRFWPIGFLLALADRLPWGWRLALGSSVMRAAVWLLPKYRSRVDGNLQMIFPDLAAKERRRIRYAMGDNFGRTIIEVLDNPRFHERGDWIAPQGAAADALLEAAHSGRGAVLITGHFGQWEALRGWLKTLGIPCGGVYRAVGNPDLNEVYEEAIRFGGPVFNKDRSGVRAMVRHLSKRQLLAIGADQFEKRGARLDFIGAPAPTTLVPAEMALRFGMPLIPFYGLREPNRRTIRIILEDEIPPTQAEEMMQAANDSLAAMVRAHPVQYYWLHRRWTKDMPGT